MSAIRLRIPLAQYSYLEYDFEGTPEEAIEEMARVTKLYENSQKDKPGLSQRDFARYKRDIMNGGYQMEDEDNASAIQKWWRHEAEKTIQQLKNQQYAKN